MSQPSAPDPFLEDLIAHYQVYRGTDYCKIQELALILGVKRPTVYNWLKRKGSPVGEKRNLAAQWLEEKKNQLEGREC